MVKMIVAALVLVTGTPACAQTVDWSRAGGGLFGPVSAVQDDPAPVDAPFRLATPDQPFAQAIEAAAERHGVDPKLLHALVLVESRYDPDACSPAGACGLTQLMPGTARDLGVRNRFDPADNLDAGANYLARQMTNFGDLRLALAAYNAGPGRVARFGRIPDIAETRDYVVRVVECYLALTAGRGVRSSRDCLATAGRP